MLTNIVCECGYCIHTVQNALGVLLFWRSQFLLRVSAYEDFRRLNEGLMNYFLLK